MIHEPLTFGDHPVELDVPGLPGCGRAPRDRKPTAEEGGGKAPTTWTANWCAQMLMGDVMLFGTLVKQGKLPPKHVSPMSGMFEGGSIGGVLPVALEVGFAYPVSIHLVRAREHLSINPLQSEGTRTGPDRPEPPHREAGTFHFGRYCIRPDGFEHVIHCSEPWEGQVGGVGFGEPFLHRAGLFSGDVERITDDAIGFELDFAAYMTPFIQETSLRSFKPSCAVWI